VANRPDEDALFRIAGNDHRTVAAALLESLGRVQSQPCFLLGLAVAGIATVREDGPDLRLEEANLLRRRRHRPRDDRTGRPQPGRQSQNEQTVPHESARVGAATGKRHSSLAMGWASLGRMAKGRLAISCTTACGSMP